MKKQFLGITLVFLSGLFSLISTADENNTYMSAVALNVVSLEKSTAFYTEVFGMSIKRNISNDSMSENIMAFANGKGASLVLVQYKSKEVIEEKTARIVFYAPDPKSIIEKGVTLGATIVRAPQESESMKSTVGIMRDLDGYLVEVIQK